MRAIRSGIQNICIGIRKEDALRIWERRCPLTPQAVSEMISQHENLKVLIQDCDRRVYPTQDFIQAGAFVHPSLSPADIIIGIKETPLNELLTSPVSSNSGLGLRPRTHLMFSHTAKGQSYNLPLLSRFISPNNSLSPTLIDYELMTGADGKRVVGFGWFAGAAGLVEGLVASAHDHLKLGVASPFLHLSRPYSHVTLHEMRQSLRLVGQRIAEHGTPRAIGPFIIGVTGNGNVSKGALDLFKELPVCYVTPEDLPILISNSDTNLHKVYVVHVQSPSYLVHASGKRFARADYYARPSDFKSIFHEKIAPYLTLLVNGAGWQPGFPRLISNSQLAIALRKARAIDPSRFRTVADVSCDVEGGLEFVTRPTTIDQPCFIARPADLPVDLEGIQVMSIDILPSQLPLDASQHFSKALVPYLNALIRKLRKSSTEADAPVLQTLDKAAIAVAGKLTAAHTWLSPQITSSVDAQEKYKKLPTLRARKKTVVLLGSGMVAKPAVEEFSKRADLALVIASNNATEASALAQDHPGAEVVELNALDPLRLDSLIQRADIVVSLLPAPMHPKVAEHCIRYGKHLVTASYISPGMAALHERALAADVLLLNEIGLDPGIDHCTAVDLRTRLSRQNKTITSFISFCGGLPVPEHSDVPLRYKFSWSPRGVLTAALNSARFKLLGQTIEIPGEKLLDSCISEVPIGGGFALEGLANRDSFPYGEVYRLGPVQGLNSLFRGTLRYKGFSSLMSSFKSLGLLEQGGMQLQAWDRFASAALSRKLNVTVSNDMASIRSALSDVLGGDKEESVAEALEWLSMVPASIDSSLPPVPVGVLAPIDLLAVLLSHKLRYQPQERDLVLLSHEIIAKPIEISANGRTSEEINTSTLIVRGTASASAMSRCVGLPVAFASLRVLDGKIKCRGVVGPASDPDIYRPILEDLESVGLGMTEKMRVGRKVAGIGPEILHNMKHVW